MNMTKHVILISTLLLCFACTSGQKFSKEYQVELETEIEADPINDERFKPIADLYSEHILPHLIDGEFNPFKLNNEFFMPVLEVLSKNRLERIVKEDPHGILCTKN